MDIILDWEKKEFEFRGKNLTAMLKSLKTEDMLLLTPYMPKDSKDSLTLTMSSLEIQKLSKELFPKYVKDLTGFIQKGKEISS